MSSHRNPAPVLREDALGVQNLLDELKGSLLSRVEYANFVGGAKPSLWHVRRTGVEPVDMAVALRLGERWVRVDWAAPSITVGLSLLVLDAPEFPSQGVMNASRTDAWAGCLGMPLTTYELAWFTAEDGVMEALLAARLHFGEMVRAVMLGEVVDAGVKYLPDALVVLADQELAELTVSRFGGTWKS